MGCVLWGIAIKISVSKIRLTFLDFIHFNDWIKRSPNWLFLGDFYTSQRLELKIMIKSEKF